MMPFAQSQQMKAPEPQCGGRLVAVDGRELPLTATAIAADARAGLARVELSQTFVNDQSDPLEVTYAVPLPADGAVVGFRFEVGGAVSEGEVDRKARARERFEEALISGQTAALLDEERSSLFRQRVGNIPAGETVVVHITLDQPLTWRSDRGGSWEWRFPTVVAPRYMGAPGRVEDAASVSVDVADRPLPVRAGVEMTIRDTIGSGGVECLSHDVASNLADGATHVFFRDEAGVRLDRDVVLLWPAATGSVGVTLDRGRPAAERPHAAHAYGLLTIAPPAPDVAPEPVARDLIVLLDSSGSMHGEPIAQAKRVIAALIGGLGERDRLELIEFSNRPRRWQRRPQLATERARHHALAWLAKVSAGGGTEMRSGVLEALNPLRGDAQRQIVLVSDGLIGFEQEIVAAIRKRVPERCRFHTVGVGSSVNRSLTMAAARAGRGEEILIGLGEDPERASARLLARTSAPIVVDLELEGDALVDASPAGAPDLFAGAPALLSVRLRSEGGTLRVRGRTEAGPWMSEIDVPPTAAGDGNQAVVQLYGRESVEDLEMLRSAAPGKAESFDRQIEQIGLQFQISTRLTSWIAVSRTATVDPGDPTRRVEIPQELPHGMSVAGLGLRAAPGMIAAQYAGAPAMSARAQTFTGTLGHAARARRAAAASPGPPPPPAPTSPPASMSRPPSDRPEMSDDESIELEEFAQAESPAEPMERLSVGRAAPPPRQPLRARLLSVASGRVVLSISVTELVEWMPGKTAVLELSDGTVHEVEIIAGTTRLGAYRQNQQIRLVLACTIPAGVEPLEVRLPDRRGNELSIAIGE